MNLSGKGSGTFLAWLATLGCIGIILYPSFLSEPIDYKFNGMDKIFHVIAYAILSFLMGTSLRKSGIRNYALLGMMLALSIGLADETHQVFVQVRNASATDLLADSLGSFAGAYFSKLHFLSKLNS